MNKTENCELGYVYVGKEKIFTIYHFSLDNKDVYILGRLLVYASKLASDKIHTFKIQIGNVVYQSKGKITKCTSGILEIKGKELKTLKS